MNNKAKYVSIILSLWFLFSVGIGLIWKNSLKDCGLARLTSFTDIMHGQIGLEYAWGQHEIDSEGFLDSLVHDSQEYINELIAAPIIVKGKPTGNLLQTTGSLGQEIQILEILSGADYIQLEKYYIYQYYGLHIKNNKISYMNALNLSDPECEYLFFLFPSELNDHTEEKSFYITSLLGYINISIPTTQTIVKPIDQTSLEDIRGLDFLSCSKEITFAMNNIKKEVMALLTE